MKAEIQGLFFDRFGTPTSDDVPVTALTVGSDELNRSSGNFRGRISFQVDGDYQLVWLPSLDGVELEKRGMNIPKGIMGGQIDVNLFRYPNSARANKPGSHTVTVQVGLRKGFWASVWNLSLPSVQWMSTGTFTINLLPHTIAPD